MVWKPKEKPLTAEEAVVIAKKELQPFWFGSIPLLAGIRNGNAATVHPLDVAFTSRPWTILFIDPTTYTGEAALVFAKEWNGRYRAHGLGILAVLRSPYTGTNLSKGVENLIRRMQLDFPVVIDQEGLLAMSFRAESAAKIVLVHQSVTLYESTDLDFSKGIEMHIQSFLRSTDPGLPLFPPYAPQAPLARDLSRFELGSTHGPKLAPGGIGAVNFTASHKTPSKTGDLAISGSWIQEPDRMTTTDPAASIHFYSPSAKVSVVAENLGKSVDPALVAVEVNGVPAFDSFGGAHLNTEENGLSAVSVGFFGMYHALSGLPAKERVVRFHFPDARNTPIAVYGLRFGE